MTRRIALVTIAAMLLGALPLGAHESFRFVGVITGRTQTRFVMETRDGESLGIDLNAQTKVTRDKKAVNQREIKAGQTVVVDAYGDDADDLLAIEVRLVPPIPARK